MTQQAPLAFHAAATDKNFRNWVCASLNASGQNVAVAYVLNGKGLTEATQAVNKALEDLVIGSPQGTPLALTLREAREAASTAGSALSALHVVEYCRKVPTEPESAASASSLAPTIITNKSTTAGKPATAAKATSADEATAAKTKTAADKSKKAGSNSAANTRFELEITVRALPAGFVCLLKEGGPWTRSGPHQQKIDKQDFFRAMKSIDFNDAVSRFLAGTARQSVLVVEDGEPFDHSSHCPRDEAASIEFKYPTGLCFTSDIIIDKLRESLTRLINANVKSELLLGVLDNGLTFGAVSSIDDIQRFCKENLSGWLRRYLFPPLPPSSVVVRLRSLPPDEWDADDELVCMPLTNLNDSKTVQALVNAVVDDVNGMVHVAQTTDGAKPLLHFVARTQDVRSSVEEYSDDAVASEINPKDPKPRWMAVPKTKLLENLDRWIVEIALDLSSEGEQVRFATVSASGTKAYMTNDGLSKTLEPMGIYLRSHSDVVTANTEYALISSTSMNVLLCPPGEGSQSRDQFSSHLGGRLIRLDMVWEGWNDVKVHDWRKLSRKKHSAEKYLLFDWRALTVMMANLKPDETVTASALASAKWNIVLLLESADLCEAQNIFDSVAKHFQGSRIVDVWLRGLCPVKPSVSSPSAILVDSTTAYGWNQFAELVMRAESQNRGALLQPGRQWLEGKEVASWSLFENHVVPELDSFRAARNSLHTRLETSHKQIERFVISKSSEGCGVTTLLRFLAYDLATTVAAALVFWACAKPEPAGLRLSMAWNDMVTLAKQNKRRWIVIVADEQLEDAMADFVHQQGVAAGLQVLILSARMAYASTDTADGSFPFAPFLGTSTDVTKVCNVFVNHYESASAELNKAKDVALRAHANMYDRHIFIFALTAKQGVHERAIAMVERMTRDLSDVARNFLTAVAFVSAFAPLREHRRLPLSAARLAEEIFFDKCVQARHLLDLHDDEETQETQVSIVHPYFARLILHTLHFVDWTSIADDMSESSMPVKAVATICVVFGTAAKTLSDCLTGREMRDVAKHLLVTRGDAEGTNLHLPSAREFTPLVQYVLYHSGNRGPDCVNEVIKQLHNYVDEGHMNVLLARVERYAARRSASLAVNENQKREEHNNISYKHALKAVECAKKAYDVLKGPVTANQLAECIGFEASRSKYTGQSSVYRIKRYSECLKLFEELFKEAASDHYRAHNAHQALRYSRLLDREYSEDELDNYGETEEWTTRLRQFSAADRDELDTPQQSDDRFRPIWATD